MLDALLVLTSELGSHDLHEFLRSLYDTQTVHGLDEAKSAYLTSVGFGHNPHVVVVFGPPDSEQLESLYRHVATYTGSPRVVAYGPAFEGTQVPDGIHFVPMTGNHEQEMRALTTALQ